MEQHLTKLAELKQQIGSLPEEDLTGSRVQGLLSELRVVLAALEADPGVDKSRLASLAAFVGSRQSLDPIVTKVLLGLIGKLAGNPTASVKPAPNFDDLMGKIPGLREAMDNAEAVDNTAAVENTLPGSPKLETYKQGVEPDISALLGKIPGLEAALKADNATETPVDLVKTQADFVAQQAERVKQQVEKVKQQAEQSRQAVEPVQQPAAPVNEPAVEISSGAAEAAASAAVENVRFETRELLGFFLQEAGEQVENFSNGLLEMEKDGARLDLVNELFRTAHTLKGASGTMGFNSIVKITHLSEDVLDSLRQGRCSVSPALIDLLLGVADRVKQILGEIQEGGEGKIPTDDLVERLENFLGKAKTVQVVQTQKVQAETLPGQQPFSFELDDLLLNQAKELGKSGLKTWDLAVQFESGVLMPSVRAVMVVRRIEQLGRVLLTSPSTEELRKESHQDFHILFATDRDIREVESIVMQVPEISALTSSPYEMKHIPVEVINMAEVVRLQDQQQHQTAEGHPSSAATSGGPVGLKNQTIRVPAEKLDDLLNLVGEMVIARTRLVSEGEALEESAQNTRVNALNETIVYLGRLMNELQESVMAMRMVPIGYVFSRFPRMVRDLARKTDKEVELAWFGEDTELDKTIIQEINDPLMHILRNCVDHGIEPVNERIAAGKPPVGKITIEALHEGSHIVVAISDDGRGIDINKVKDKAVERGFIPTAEGLNDKEAANLIFMPGLSTASQVTDVSGRGVGMDVVKRSLTNLGGMIDVATTPGRGTTLTIRLPLTLAIIQALLVDVSQETYAIPLASVLETLRVARSEIKSVGGHPVIQLRGSTLPLISLQRYFGLKSNVEDEYGYVVVVGFGEKRLGLIVNSLQGQQEIVIKSLSDFLVNVEGFSGATIGGDGRVVLILDVGSLIQDTLVVNRI